VDVFVPNRHRLGLVFQDFDAQAVRRNDKSLIQPLIVAGQHRNAICFPLGRLLLDVLHDEPDMVHY
jgi:hypothetical protein